MTDRNIDRRLLFTLYMDLATKSLEMKWAAEEWSRTNAFWQDKVIESTVEQNLRMESATMPVRQCIARITNLLLRPDTKEPNTFTIENALETDVRLLSGYRSSLGGTYEDVLAATDVYVARIFARIEQLFLDVDAHRHVKEEFGENLTLDLSEVLPENMKGKNTVAEDAFVESL